MKVVDALISIAVLLLPMGVSAQGPPWVESPPREDAKYFYYLGRSGVSVDDKQAIDRATEDAVTTAIREHFGVGTEITHDVYETEHNLHVDRRARSDSPRVLIRGFEIKETEIARLPDGSGGKVQAWVLFRYAKAAISAEKSRLASLPATAPSELPISVMGQAEGPEDTDLTIQTTDELGHAPVSGAQLLIDGESYGKTPIRLLGQLKPGSHTLILDHPNFETIEEKVILTPGAKKVLLKKLQPAHGRLSIVTNRDNAIARIQGKNYDLPAQDIVVEANRPLELKITHPEAELWATLITVEKGEHREIRAQLLIKSATVVITSIPAGARVDIDGESYTTPTGKITVSAGTQQILVEKRGYASERLEVDLRGGEKRVIPTFRLEPIADGASAPSRGLSWVPELKSGLTPESQKPMPTPELETGPKGLSFGGGAQWITLPLVNSKEGLWYQQAFVRLGGAGALEFTVFRGKGNLTYNGRDYSVDSKGWTLGFPMTLAVGGGGWFRHFIAIYLLGGGALENTYVSENGYRGKSDVWVIPLGLGYQVMTNTRAFSLGIDARCVLFIQGVEDSDTFIDPWLSPSVSFAMGF